jgi:hypothetical protein
MKINISQMTIGCSLDLEWKVAHEMVSEQGYYKAWDAMIAKLDGLWEAVLFGADSSDERAELLDDLKVLKAIARQHRFAYLDQEAA